MYRTQKGYFILKRNREGVVLVLGLGFAVLPFILLINLLFGDLDPLSLSLLQQDLLGNPIPSLFLLQSIKLCNLLSIGHIRHGHVLLSDGSDHPNPDSIFNEPFFDCNISKPKERINEEIPHKYHKVPLARSLRGLVTQSAVGSNRPTPPQSYAGKTFQPLAGALGLRP